MKYMKKSFEAMVPYFSKNLESGIILNANEAPYLPPREVLEEFTQEIQNVSFNRYPDMACEKLCEAIANRYKISKSEVACGVGSDELLETTFKAVLEPKDKVVSFSPSFSMYKVFADLCLAEFIQVDFNLDYTFNVDSILREIKQHQPKIVLICTPNNPTGAFLSKSDAIKIITSTSALVILDMAYIDFADEDYTNIALEYENVIVFKTFSKAMALPSIRVGYAISNKENIDMIHAVKAPYSVTTASQIMARIAISHYDLYQDLIKEIKKERQRVYETLKECGFEVYPSSANFLFLKMDDALNDVLLQNNIYIRKMKSGVYRISIGSKEENTKLLEVMKNYETK